MVPELLFDVLQPDRLAWLVPGLWLEKVTAVFRALPKALRKPLVPVPDHAREALAEIGDDSSADGAVRTGNAGAPGGGSGVAPGGRASGGPAENLPGFYE